MAFSLNNIYDSQTCMGIYKWVSKYNYIYNYDVLWRRRFGVCAIPPCDSYLFDSPGMAFSWEGTGLRSCTDAILIL